MSKEAWGAVHKGYGKGIVGPVGLTANASATAPSLVPSCWHLWVCGHTAHCNDYGLQRLTGLKFASLVGPSKTAAFMLQPNVTFSSEQMNAEATQAFLSTQARGNLSQDA